MATLIGRDCWHAGAVLSYGRIVKHDLESGAVVVHRGVALGDITVHAQQVLLTLDAAIDAAEESEDYWHRKVEELRREERKQNAP